MKTKEEFLKVFNELSDDELQKIASGTHTNYYCIGPDCIWNPPGGAPCTMFDEKTDCPLYNQYNNKDND